MMGAMTMKIDFKLYASLAEFLPQDGRVGNIARVEVAEGSTVMQVIEAHAVPLKYVHLVLVNGHYIAPAERHAHVLKHGDALALWPPIAGG
ncbi:MAG: hypothetical protein RL722_2185 [Pseudomonadota bacterium]|jgi:molybdopterin converting factor small subunit